MSERPLVQDAWVDEPGFVGARWWQESVVDPVGRRQLLMSLLLASGGLGAAGAVLEACPPTRRSRLGTLDLQRQYGWSFGATGDNLVFNGQTNEPFDSTRLARMSNELAPRSPRHRPFYVATLFEAPAAPPTSHLDGDPAVLAPLAAALRPIFTIGMRDAFRAAAQSAGAMLQVPGVALVVDLDGQDSVAFAAGAASRFDPVFLFDNWPHPHGVVPAHLTLAAAAYYQPLFDSVERPADAPPMFVLDRRRLAAYADDAAHFDNRWVARLPGASALTSLGVRHLLYVAPEGTRVELDDLNDDFVADHAAGVALTLLDVSALDAGHLDVPYVPLPRRTPFSSGRAGGGRPTPDHFGTVPVTLGLLSGSLVGVAWDRPSWGRSGSWNRGISVGG